MDHMLDFAASTKVAQIAALWEAGWHDAHSDIVPAHLTEIRTTKSFLDRTRQNLAATRVIHDGTDLFGFCMVAQDELYQLYVAPQARGIGVARILIRDAERRIIAAGHSTAWLACAVGNTRAARFYEKSGWRNAGLKVVELDTSADAFPLEVWRFEKRLNKGGE